MATEPFVPEHRDSVYVDDELPPAKAWYARRPGEIAFDPDAEMYGFVGPDAGYVGTLIPLFESQIRPEVANREDIIAAGKAIGMRRAARYGRAPIAEDLEIAFNVLGAFDDVPGDWSSVRAEIDEHIRGFRYPIAAGRATEFAESIPPDWIDPKPPALRDRLAAEGPTAAFAAAPAH